MGQRLDDEDVERIARRVVSKIARLVALIVLAFVGLSAFLLLLLNAVRVSGPDGISTGAAGWLIALATAAVLLFVLAAWRLVRRGP